MSINSIHKHSCKGTQNIAFGLFLFVLFLLTPISLHSEKFNACGTDSIWSAYLIDKRTDEMIESYYPEEFFTDQGGALPNYNSNRDPYIVPEFVYAMQSCDLDSFMIRFRYRYSDPYIYGSSYKAVATIWFTVQEEFDLDMDEILRSKIQKKQVSISEENYAPSETGLRYGSYEQEMWFKYKDGVIYKSGGGSSRYNICTLDQLGLSWDYLGGMITYMSVQINDDFYEEDFTDCSNAMKYKECPPKEPDFIKIICEQIPDCRNDKYKFYTESNLGEIHWASLDGLSQVGDKLTLLQEQFNGGCVAVWAQKDPCTPPVYDTICPPMPDVRVRETEVKDTICWCDPYSINGIDIKKSGIYQKVYTASNGCDSIVRYQVTVNSGDTTLTDTVYRCGITKITDKTFLYDTVEVAGACPDVQMSPVGKISSRNHVSIKTIKNNRDEVSFDFENNIGNVVYTTVWMGNKNEQTVDKTVVFDKAGMYKIIAYDEETGCKDSIDYYYLTPIKPEKWFCPDDTEDNTWDIDGLEKYSNYVVEIFDRFGKKLITYENEFDGWDGTYRGKPLPSTDYWYTIEVDEGDISMNGHFTLLRRKK